MSLMRFLVDGQAPALDVHTTTLFGAKRWRPLSLSARGAKEGAAQQLPADLGEVVGLGWELRAAELPGGGARAVAAAAADAYSVRFSFICATAAGAERVAVALQPRLTALLRCFEGAVRLHNFCDARGPSDTLSRLGLC